MIKKLNKDGLKYLIDRLNLKPIDKDEHGFNRRYLFSDVNNNKIIFEWWTNLTNVFINEIQVIITHFDINPYRPNGYSLNFQGYNEHSNDPIIIIPIEKHKYNNGE